MKEQYQELEVEIIRFDNEDVIEESLTNDGDID